MHKNVARVSAVLDEAGLHERVRELSEGVHTAAAAAAYLECPVGAIANSLVFAADAGVVLVLTSGAHRVDTAHLAAQIGVPALGRATPEQVKAATGQPIGGVAPVGHPAPVATYLDRTLAQYDTIWAAAGIPASVWWSTYPELLALTGAHEVTVN